MKMDRFCFKMWLLTGLVAMGLCMSSDVLAQDVAGAPAQTPQSGDREQPAVSGQDEPKIRFRFDEIEWKEVIEWFADQAGLSLYPVVQPPEGTFKYYDDQEYTVQEALDQLNHALMLQGGYTLIRNRKLLVLTRKSEGYPSELIETVAPEQLETRGKYEIVRCEFDLTNLEGTGIVDDIERMIDRDHRDGFIVVESARKLIVRETGEKLRLIREVLERARKQAIAKQTEFAEYRVKHVEAPTLLDTVRALMEIDPDENRTRDDSLSFTLDPVPGGSDRIILKGTPERLQEFMKIAEMVDVESTVNEAGEIEKPYLAFYPVSSEPEMTFQIVQTMFEGEDVKMDQDSVTGNIAFLARKEQHQRMKEYLDTLANSGDRFAAIPLANENPDDVVIKLQAMFRQNPDEPTTKGPVFYADSLNDQILVSGTPHEIEMVREMVATLDKGEPRDTGPRSNQRFIEMTPFEADRVMTLLPDLFPTTGRQNRLQIVMPEDRERFRSRLDMRRRPGATEDDEWEQMMRTLDSLDSGSSNDSPDSNSSDRDRDNGGAGNDDGAIWSPERKPAGSGSRKIQTAIARIGQDHFRTVSIRVGITDNVSGGSAKPVPQERDQDGQGSAQDDDKQDIGKTTEDEQVPDYTPPKPPKSVPGAPIIAKQTEYGVVLSSDDLDALDDAANLIFDLLDSSSTQEFPTVFYLYHRKAVEAKAWLDELLGIGDGGGGGGGLAGMMGGMLSNAVGGGAGDALGALLGGGGGLAGGTTGIELEGDVRIGTDVRFNTLVVSGATSNDLQVISELIDYIDQPEPPLDLDLVGKTYYIPIIHRDPQEVLEKVQNQFSEYLKKEDSGGGQNPEAQQAQQMMRMMQQLTGRGGGAGGGSDPEASKPTAVVGVDPTTRLMFVTGPKFIYLRVLEFVEKLDTPDTTQSERKLVTVEKSDAEVIARTLAAMLGEKGELVIGGKNGSGASGSAAGGAAGGSGGAPSTNNAGGTNADLQARQEQMRAAIINAMRNRGGGGGGGRDGGGGGGRGGGGGGGRGGGGGGRGGGR